MSLASVPLIEIENDPKSTNCSVGLSQRREICRTLLDPLLGRSAFDCAALGLRAFVCQPGDVSDGSFGLRRLFLKQEHSQAAAALWLMANTLPTDFVPRLITPRKPKRRRCLRVSLLEE